MTTSSFRFKVLCRRSSSSLGEGDFVQWVYARDADAAITVARGHLLSEDFEIVSVEAEGDIPPISYSVGTDCRNDCIDSPNGAMFSIDRTFAVEIVRLAKFLSDNHLFSVSKFDDRVTWKRYDEQTATDLAEENGDFEGLDYATVRIFSHSVRFVAQFKHSGVEVLTEDVSIPELAAHFGVPFSPAL